MAEVLTIRKLDEEVQTALRRRAALSGRSMEAEAREILRSACLPETNAEWARGARERARARTAGRPQTDSAELIREDRDAR